MNSPTNVTFSRTTCVSLYRGRCEDVLPSITDKSVDLVFADLPYGTTNCAWDSLIDLNWLWGEYRRICRGAFLLFAQTPFDKVLGASNIPMLKYEWIWEKTHPTGHLNAKKMPMKAHENVLVFYDKSPTYNPVMTSGHVRKSATKRGRKTPTIYGSELNRDGVTYDSTDRYPRSVVVFPSDKQHSNLHPTQKPLALCEYFVRTYSNPGDTILDNTMGVGTIPLAAAINGRSSIGIEMVESYFKSAVNRIESDTRMLAISGLINIEVFNESPL